MGSGTDNSYDLPTRQSRTGDPILPMVEEIFHNCMETLKRRGEDYSSVFNINDYMPHGHLSYHQMCHLKVMRALSEAVAGRDPQDSLLDLINYAAFWLAYERLKGTELNAVCPHLPSIVNALSASTSINAFGANSPSRGK